MELAFRCEDPGGGFAGNVGHEPHILYTLSGLQLLAMAGRLGEANKATVDFIVGLVNEDGSCVGIAGGEPDTR